MPVVRCTETHECPSFGEVPEGSLWNEEHDVVQANPSAFAAVDLDGKRPKKG